MRKKLYEKFKKIKLLALDFDGVLTDGFVYVAQDGTETVRCSRRDGFGIDLLKKSGFIVGVISQEKNPVVRVRCRKLKIPCWSGVVGGKNKAAILRRFISQYKLTASQAAYMGDDVNDLEPMKSVGVSIAVADGHAKIKKVADYITRAKGGHHAVREVAELILKTTHNA